MECKQKALVIDPIHSSLKDYINQKFDVTFIHPITREALLEIIGKYNILILRSGAKVDKTLLDRSHNLKTIVRAGTGTDNIDLDEVNARGINFYNTPGTNSRAVAELSFGLMHCLYRHIRRASNEIEVNIWDKKSLQGFELTKKTLGLVGLGSIGKEIVRIAKGYRMDINCLVYEYSSSRAEMLREDNITLHNSLHEMLGACDIVVLCCPYNEKTKNLIDENALSHLKKDSILINVARGGVVNEESLYQALKKNNLYGAASDVFLQERKPSPLFSLKNFIGTPHIGAMTHESQKNIANLVIDYLKETQEKAKTDETHPLY